MSITIHLHFRWHQWSLSPGVYVSRRHGGLWLYLGPMRFDLMVDREEP